MHICISKTYHHLFRYWLVARRRQAIIWTNPGILLIRTLGTNFSEIIIKIHTFSFMKMRLKVPSAKWPQYCLGLNVLNINVNEATFSHHRNIISTPESVLFHRYWTWARRRQVIIWTNPGILLIRTLGINFSEIIIKIHTFSFMKMHLKVPSAKWRHYCLGLDVFNTNVNEATSSHHRNIISTPESVLFYRYWTPPPGNKVHGANMGPIWGRQDLGGPHIFPMNFAIWASTFCENAISYFRLIGVVK